jgi:hypothetical protein
MNNNLVWVTFVSFLKYKRVQFPIGYRIKVNKRIADFWRKFDFVRLESD